MAGGVWYTGEPFRCAAVAPCVTACLCAPMSEFVERLPWRLAALAGLLVGATSLLGGTDIWITLLRVGAALAVFGLLGLGLRALLLPGMPDAPNPDGRRSGGPDGPAPGAHVDQSTPEMTVEDLKSPKGNPPPRQAGDGSRTP